MIDLHTHTILSDGMLLPSELVRRAHVNGVKAIAITDHVDSSNIKPVITGLVEVASVLNRHWDIFVMPGVEITHVPVEEIASLVTVARGLGAKVVVIHGESPVEPVIKGTNTAGILSGADILAHPGYISIEDARLAAEKNVCLEITSRKGHNETNGHVFNMAIQAGAGMVINTDSHAPCDIMTKDTVNTVLAEITDSGEVIQGMMNNSEEIVRRAKKG